jgi:transcriptional regulator with XRE-family HTH domain
MGENQRKNRIWLYRKRMRLRQKHVAYLMGLKSANHVSHYECGRKLPMLENAIKLEVILNVPVSFLFPELASRIRKEVLKRREQLRYLPSPA